MIQHLADFWNELNPVFILLIGAVIWLGLHWIQHRITTPCPQCGGKFKRVDEDNNLIERITNAMTKDSLIDPELPDTRFFRCTGCGFETDNLNTMEFNSRLDRLKPSDSKPTKLK